MSDADRFQRVMAIFEQACERPAEARAAFVASASGDDATLAREVLAMLAHDETAARIDSPFAEPGVGQHLLAHAIATSADERVPPTVPEAGHLASHPRDRMPVLAGHYRIIRVLGEGGMGIVYLAEQARPRRLVAMKAIRPGMASRTMLRRFEHETQMLGRLQHPGIAQIYEAGAADEASPDQAYFAMEYVAGPPLHDYAAGRALTMRERVQLMIRVCDAVHHAHQRGVIHRDLKPNNIHVEDSGQPKVLDFGVARFAAGTGGDHHTTMHTQAGQLVGTLAYMSPEQVAGDPDAVDVRSDVYALGVMLYQLLVHQLPLDFGRSALAEAARIIREVEPLRLGAIDRGLRGDLETIASRALEKDRDRRYQSAADLRDDLQRHLDGLPIIARQDSAMYVLRRILRRHRTIVATAVLALTSLVAFAAYASMMATRNSDLADRERVAREHADDISRNLERELAVSSIERGRMAGKTGSLVPAEQLLWSAYGRDPNSRHVHWALWELYSRLPCRATIDTGITRMRGMSVDGNGELIALAGDPSRVEIRSLRDDAMLHVLSTDGANASAVAFSPDGALLAGGDESGAIIIWNIVDMTRRHVLPSGGQAVRHIAWSPAGDQLAWTTADLHLHLWSPVDGAEPADYAPVNVRPFGGATPMVEYTPDGAHLAWCGIDQHVRLVPVDDPSATAYTLSGHTDRVFTIAFTKDGRTAYTGSNDRDIRQWDLATASCTAVFTAPNGLVRCVRLSEDERSLMSIGWWSLDLWDIASQQRTRTIPIPSGAFASWWSADGVTALTGHATSSLRIWDLAPAVFDVYADGNGRCAAAISRDAALTAVGDSAGRVIVRDRQAKSILWSADAHARRIYALQFSPDGSLLLTGGADGMLKLWDARSGELLREVSGHDANTSDSASFSNDGTRVVAAWRDGSFHLLNTADFSLITAFGRAPTQALAARFSDDDRFIATTAREMFVRIWSADGQPVSALPTAEQSWIARFSPDGRRVTTGTWGRTIEVLDVASASPIAVLEGHNGLVSGIAIDPASTGLIASAAADGIVRLWDADELRNLLILDAFEVEAITVDLSADGRWLIAAGADGTTKVWDLHRFNSHVQGNRAHQMARIAGIPSDETVRE